MNKTAKDRPMRLVVVGANGRMGRELIRAIAASNNVQLVGAVARPDSAWIGHDSGEMVGIGGNGITLVGEDPLSVFLQADGVVDFTTPAATSVFASLAAQAGIVHIIGTTGLSAHDEETIRAASSRTAIVKSGNMSLGVNLLAALVKQAAQRLRAQDFDIEIVEMHHRRKLDAPSGTALLLGEEAAKGRGVVLDDVSVRGRDGITGKRASGTIGFASLRGGTVVGEHQVIFAGEGERLILSHSAEHRYIYASGAIKAALWARSRPPGLYSMLDVLDFNH